MALKVIGSGLGRTGTISLKLALEQLGFGPTHHMVEVLVRPQTMALWVAAGEGRPDWEAIFEGYQSVVDYPGAVFWRDLIDYYPDAKVVHSLRDPVEWFESTQETIFAPRPAEAPPPPPVAAAFMGLIHGQFGDRIHDRDYMVEHFKRHTESVEAAVPKDRLLLFEAKQGWAPLCAFLGRPVPDTPYPRGNDRESFKANFGGASRDQMNDPAHVKSIVERMLTP